eukprot:gb/GFBE01053372.1/.p1 GENE.gb/GFBE01053372.1/~~gb/GFBE01053372.1/.p1  ORF type:complete len:458 (+),score=97.94 gb/GFBE01053372.1/:1-1374(+)
MPEKEAQHYVVAMTNSSKQQLFWSFLFISMLGVQGVGVQVGSGTSRVASFEAFKETFRRTYIPGTEEHERRREFFEASLRAVEEQNSRPDRLWNAALNGLSDLSPEERKSLDGYGSKAGPYASQERVAASLLQQGSVTRRKAHPTHGHHHKHPAKSASLIRRGGEEGDLPTDVSYKNLWTTKRDHVRSQSCGNCWAAATSTLLEAHAELHQGIHRPVSLTSMTECTENKYHCGGEGGCSGATSELALLSVVYNGISEGEDEKICAAQQVHNYIEDEPAPHEFPSGKVVTAPENSPSRQFGLIGFERLPSNKYLPVLQALVQRGPATVAVATDWSNYGDGIYDGCNKDADIGHAVVLIGYGQDATKPGKDGKPTKYWLIQNSWGADWGEDGHIRIKRHNNEEEYCGIDHSPKDGVICDSGPAEEKVCGSCGMLYDVTVPHFESVTEEGRKMAALRKDK